MSNNAERSGIGECFTSLAALGALVPRLRLGSLVAGNTYRHPAVLANMADTIDHISDGRMVLGIGAGWQQNEHEAYGIELPPPRPRLQRFEEACAVLRSLLSQSRTTFDGEYYQLVDAPLEPRPIQDPIPLLIGGAGEKVMLNIVARYADEWNCWGTPETLRHKIEVLSQHCAAVGRDPATIHKSAQVLWIMEGENDPATSAPSAQPTLSGSPQALAEALGEYAAAGVDEVIVPDWNLGPIDSRLRIYDRFFNEAAAEVH
jgi:alkanesulfonate monooxygenase SsuD/methylene tetrahydromethanopterin reductase-like flavin-dependent oxidoreductase (luciferase family)